VDTGRFSFAEAAASRYPGWLEQERPYLQQGIKENGVFYIAEFLSEIKRIKKTIAVNKQISVNCIFVKCRGKLLGSR
jgi:hypothetical protein